MAFRVWNKELVREAYVRFHKETGKIPTWKAIATRIPEILERPEYMPTHSTVIRYYGSHTNACMEIFGEYHPHGTALDADTEVALRDQARGKTITALARERGISSQALGRRMRRYIEMYEL